MGNTTSRAENDDEENTSAIWCVPGQFRAGGLSHGELEGVYFNVLGPRLEGTIETSNATIRIVNDDHRFTIIGENNSVIQYGNNLQLRFVGTQNRLTGAAPLREAIIYTDHPVTCTDVQVNMHQLTTEGIVCQNAPRLLPLPQFVNGPQLRPNHQFSRWVVECPEDATRPPSIDLRRALSNTWNEFIAPLGLFMTGGGRGAPNGGNEPIGGEPQEMDQANARERRARVWVLPNPGDRADESDSSSDEDSDSDGDDVVDELDDEESNDERNNEDRGDPNENGKRPADEDAEGDGGSNKRARSD